MSDLLRIKDVQKLLGVSRNTVLRMRRNGLLKFVTLNARCVRVPRSEIKRIIREAQVQPVKPVKPKPLAKPKPRLMPKAQRLAMAAAAATAAH